MSIFRRRPKAPMKHDPQYWYDGGTGRGDDAEGYGCACGWFTLGTGPQSRRAAQGHREAAAA